MDKAYNPKDVEEKIYNNWEKKGYFRPEINPDGKPFSIVLPPPNVTGTLHIGHAFEDTLQDIVIRYQRMKGKMTVWVPGTDHAPIATQAKFETEHYKKTKKTRHDYSRGEFVEMIQEFALSNQATIINQLRKLGLSLDWDRLSFTFDEKREISVRTAFKQMYEAGLIYQGERIVNWDPKMQTTVSDDEIEYVEQKDPFYYFKYGPFVIGTVRPETKFGDKYVVMHPNDKRYKDYKHGEKIDLEWINGPITTTVIKDEAADMEKGSGVMTITPAHSSIDFEIAKRHGLDIEPVIDDRGILLPIAGELAGQHIKKTRHMIVEILKKKGLVEKIDENYEHNVATNYRGGGVIEPQIKKQWFIGVNKEFTMTDSKITGIKKGSKTTLKKLMQHVVSTGQIKIQPGRFEKTYFHWIDNLRDWCISRQIVYGHQIPVWYKKLKKPVEIMYYVHGTTQDNEKELATGQADVGLSERGLKEANDLKKVVSEEDFDVVFCSDLKRAVQTAEIAFGDNHKIIQDKRLRECDYGNFTQKKNSQLKGVEEKFINQKIPGGESYKDVEERIKYFLSEVEQKYQGKRVAILAHRFPQLSLEVLLNEKSWEQALNEDWRITKNYQPGWKYVLDQLTYVGIEAPAGDGWVQDADTLDTWFSSGLWTFSALGWPDKSEDIKNFHPNSVMMPGYEILFFWVARMILMSGFLLGEIPFEKVYLHGIVRDKQGRKFSKSLNNGVDPLEMIEKYGTDALRMALVYGAASGNDVMFDEQKVKGMKHFANKLWNMARFIDMNQVKSQKSKVKSSFEELEKFANHKSDKEWIKKVGDLEKETTKYLDNYQFNLASERLYEFIWHEFADVYIEDVKGRIDDNSFLILNSCFLILLKLLHPFMPFVTEAIYQQFEVSEKSIMIESWPQK